MSFNVQYSFNNGAITGIATDKLQLRQAIYANKTSITQCTLSGTAEGALTTNNNGTTAGSNNYGIFSGCKNVVVIDVSNLNVSNVTSMSCMFEDCSSLTSLDLNNFDTSNVTNMGEMFSGCSSLTSLDLNNFDTSNVTDMSYMFYKCSSLTSLDLNNFDTSNVTDINSMFYGCSSLTSLDLNNFNTSNVTDMKSMFYNCSSLTSLDLNNFDTENVTDMSKMFYNCSGLKQIIVGDKFIKPSDNQSRMFYKCDNLPSFHRDKNTTTSIVVGNDTNFKKYLTHIDDLKPAKRYTNFTKQGENIYRMIPNILSLDLSDAIIHDVEIQMEESDYLTADTKIGKLIALKDCYLFIFCFTCENTSSIAQKMSFTINNLPKDFYNHFDSSSKSLECIPLSLDSNGTLHLSEEHDNFFITGSGVSSTSYDNDKYDIYFTPSVYVCYRSDEYTVTDCNLYESGTNISFRAWPNKTTFVSGACIISQW